MTKHSEDRQEEFKFVHFQCMLTFLNELITFSVFPNMTKYDGEGRIASNLSVALPANPSSTITRMMELPIR
jgi:hypothetical protein